MPVVFLHFLDGPSNVKGINMATIIWMILINDLMTIHDIQNYFVSHRFPGFASKFFVVFTKIAVSLMLVSSIVALAGESKMNYLSDDENTK